MSLLDLSREQSAIGARFVVGAGVLVIAVSMARRRLAEPDALVGAFLVVTASVFLLSPTQFPWYYTWLVPLLALKPRLSLMLLTPLLGLFYTRFHFDARDLVDLFDFGVVWVEYLPVWLLLWWEWRKSRPCPMELSRA